MDDLSAGYVKFPNMRLEKMKFPGIFCSFNLK